VQQFRCELSGEKLMKAEVYGFVAVEGTFNRRNGGEGRYIKVPVHSKLPDGGFAEEAELWVTIFLPEEGSDRIALPNKGDRVRVAGYYQPDAERPDAGVIRPMEIEILQGDGGGSNRSGNGGGNGGNGGYRSGNRSSGNGGGNGGYRSNGNSGGNGGGHRSSGNSGNRSSGNGGGGYRSNGNGGGGYRSSGNRSGNGGGRRNDDGVPF
jgi:hypothetical protein